VKKLFFRAVGQGDSLNDALVRLVDDVTADGIEVDTRCLLAGWPMLSLMTLMGMSRLRAMVAHEWRAT